MAGVDWTPQYLNFKVTNRSHQAIDVDYWNALWNVVIAQADNNTAGIEYIKENLLEIDWSEIAEIMHSLEALTTAEIDAMFE